jgi:hypothetical protein
MIINHDKYPAVKFLKDGNLSIMYNIMVPHSHTEYFKQNKAFIEEIYLGFEEAQKAVKVYYVADTVVNAFETEDADQKLWELKDQIGDDPIISFMLLGNGMTFLYFINKYEDHGSVSVTVLSYNKNVLVGAIAGGYYLNGYKEKWENGVEGEMYATKQLCFMAKEGREPAELIRLVVGFEIFKKYADIETKTLNNTCPKATHINCLYENNLNKAVTVIDSTWYTNLIKTEGFNVRGHFRLQPVGEGRKERKLIWINDFQKNGYVREAGKLKHEASGYL